ncbi:MAG: nucleoside triphosphate pyrophosphohydrolase [Coriobacteriales bacterium]
MGSIAIVGLDEDAAGTLDSCAAARLAQAQSIVVATQDGAAAHAVRRLGFAPTTYADLGLAVDAPADAVVTSLLDLAEQGDVVLAAVSYPFLRSGVITGLLARSGGAVDVYPSRSPLQILMLALDIDPTADVDIIDVSSLGEASFTRDTHLIVTGITNAVVVAKVAEQLRGHYPAEHPVVLAGCLDARGFDLSMCRLEDLGRVAVGCRDAALYVAPSKIEPPGGFDELVRIIEVLRSPEGCPWDREQTHETLAKHMVEEAYEAVHTIREDDLAALADELGDVLLQVVLHAQIGAEEGAFTIDDVVAGIIAKIRRRHPHVFGDVHVDTSEQVMANWDAIKRQEKTAAAESGQAPGVLEGIASSLPALAYAQKISKRAAAAGFEWESVEDVWEKVREEIDELKAAEPGTPNVAEEVGDVLFSVVNVARHLGVDSEGALRDACAKFVRRWEDMESQASARGADIQELGIDVLGQLWEEAKRKERQ